MNQALYAHMNNKRKRKRKKKILKRISKENDPKGKHKDTGRYEEKQQQK
jgi:hypothetical protein